MMRKLACWKGLPAQAQSELLEDSLQELAVDCLENAPLICSLPARQRHSRWFRMLEKYHYQWRVRSERRREPGMALDELPGDASPNNPELAWEQLPPSPALTCPC